MALKKSPVYVTKEQVSVPSRGIEAGRTLEGGLRIASNATFRYLLGNPQVAVCWNNEPVWPILIYLDS